MQYIGLRIFEQFEMKISMTALAYFEIYSKTAHKHTKISGVLLLDTKHVNLQNKSTKQARQARQGKASILVQANEQMFE